MAKQLIHSELMIQWNHLVGTLGNSYLDTNPEQQEEDSKFHEEWGHQGDEELFVDTLSAPGGGNLMNKELGSEEHASD